MTIKQQAGGVGLALLAAGVLAAGCLGSLGGAAEEAKPVPAAPPAAISGPFELAPLPYDKAALAPYISAETLEYHWGKHHRACYDNLNKLVAGKPEAGKTLVAIIMESEGPTFNNAAQAWNHAFYWQCMKPAGGGEPAGELAGAIKRDFGSFENFRAEFAKTATALFGSGWTWLVFDDGKLKIVGTTNADLPMKHGQTALLVIDVWEHAYYIDYRNARANYVNAFLDKLANWDFAAANYAKATAKR